VEIREAIPQRLARAGAAVPASDAPPGVHEVRFDASHLAAGTYFYRLRAGEAEAKRKFALVR
jgi:hypothetical protein